MNWTFFPLSEWPHHVAEWDALNDSLEGLPFLHSAFMGPLIEVFAKGREKLAVARDDAGQIRIMGILKPASWGRWESFQPSQLPLGAWLNAADLSAQDMLQSLMAALPGFNIAIALTQQDERLGPRPHETSHLQTLDYIQTAWVEIQGSFEDYWAARGKNLRTNMRKQKSKLESEGVRVELESLRDATQVAEAIAQYGRMESAGWKAGGGTAIHPDNDQGRFYRAMMEAFCRMGRGCIYRYRFDGAVVAMDLCIESGDTLVILKTTYDESHKALSPAFLMRHDAFPQLFAEGRIKRVEFYGKMMEWHTRWTEHSRTLFHLNYYRWAWLLRVRARLSNLGGQRPIKQGSEVTGPA